jgi:ATP-dependent RNA helicase SUPV3L1/SUV3
MHRRAVQLCSRCRPNVWKLEQQPGTRSFGSWSEDQAQSKQRPRFQTFAPKSPSPTKGIPHFRPTQRAPTADHRTLILHRLRDYAGQWINDKTINRLESLGVTKEESEELLSAFRKCCRKLSLPSVGEYDAATLEQLSKALNSPQERLVVDRTMTRIFIDWLITPQFQSLYQTSVPQATFDRIRDIASATDFSYPAEWYPDARALKRKIIMHVGPTNSGKTHHALRALAAAKSGVYAGPLRLLAHEIWDRLNKGQIIPLGVDPDKEVEPDDTGGNDILDGNSNTTPVVTKQTNPRYVRPCNLLTGEEQRHVAEDALLSCTVEMLPLSAPFDVAVVDEIQMISDDARGSGWTAAVLGLCASEIHLCGEETAIGIIQKLVEETGDELIVNRYQRLTPLRVADEALGQLNKVKRGDCVVAFSRTEIYSIKNTI